MYRHRKRLIVKRLTHIMKIKREQSMKKMFRQFVHKRSSEIKQLVQEQKKTTQDLPTNHVQDQSEEQIDDQSGSQQEQNEEIFFDDQEDERQEQEEGTQQFSIADYISTLSPNEKNLFKRQNPDLPQTFFMSKKQKQNFFGRKNNMFENKLKNTPVRSSKNKKHVKFLQNFNFKPFGNNQKPTLVHKAKQFNQKYNTKIHFS